ncbi:hypothetical protein [uncultured Bradyrhizobium sp.]|uniref:hypothetical protein n=1 Tax=uncultured Bradyrhizobium sp. TaxID=199684 RepID=UPI0035C9FB31
MGDTKSALKKRLIFTDGIKNRFAFQEYEDGIYAIIGPFDNFTADAEFQDELTELCRRYNLKHGHLSKEKYAALSEGRDDLQS